MYNLYVADVNVLGPVMHLLLLTSSYKSDDNSNHGGMHLETTMNNLKVGRQGGRQTDR